jgi:hypothetical protein
VIDRNVITTQLEAVTIAIGGCRAITQVTVVIGDTIFDQDGTDWTSVRLGKEVPTVVDIVVSNTTPEDIARASCKLASKSIGILTVIGIKVVEGSAIEYQVVSRPLALRSA